MNRVFRGFLSMNRKYPVLSYVSLYERIKTQQTPIRAKHET